MPKATHIDTINHRLERYIAPLFTSGQRRADVTLKDLQDALGLGKSRVASFVNEVTHADSPEDAVAFLKSQLSIQQYENISAILEDRGLKRRVQPYRPRLSEEALQARAEKTRLRKAQAEKEAQLKAQEHEIKDDVQEHATIDVPDDAEVARLTNPASMARSEAQAVSEAQLDANRQRRIEAQLTPEFSVADFEESSPDFKKNMSKLALRGGVAFFEDEVRPDTYILVYADKRGRQEAESIMKDLNLSNILTDDKSSGIIKFTSDGQAFKKG